jgi:hypothetical protein
MRPHQRAALLAWNQRWRFQPQMTAAVATAVA